MNKDQKIITIMSMYALGALLVLIFIRVGSILDYHQSLMLLPLSSVDNPIAFLPGQSDKLPSGILARTGILGVVFGIIFPAVLFVSATYMKKSEN